MTKYYHLKNLHFEDEKLKYIISSSFVFLKKSECSSILLVGAPSSQILLKTFQILNEREKNSWRGRKTDCGRYLKRRNRYFVKVVHSKSYFLK